MKSFRIFLICICTIAVGLTATGCATDLSGDGLGSAEGGLDYSVDAVDSTDISSDEEFEAEAADLVAKPAGTCKCNPAPDSSGNWSVDSEGCSACTNSADCASAECWYKHAVHGALKNKGCQFNSGTAFVDRIESVELNELDGSERAGDALAAATGTCKCIGPPDSVGGWFIPIDPATGRLKESCSKCTSNPPCTTAGECYYEHPVTGKQVDQGCRWASGGIYVDPIDPIDHIDLIKLDDSDLDELDELDELEAQSDAQDSDVSFSVAGSCTCNPAPSSQGGWAVSSQSCSLCTNSTDCASAECWYTNSDGDQEEVGCRYSSKLKKKKKKKKKKIGNTDNLDF